MFLTDHFRVVPLAGLDQALFFLHIGDFNLHRAQQKMHVIRGITATADRLQPFESITHG